LILAKELYDFLFDRHKVVEILNFEEEKKRNSNNKRGIMEHLIKFMETALKYKQFELGLEKAQ
jgi:hypothetical protein